MSIFSFESPFMSLLTRAAEFMIVSLITALLCIPVITAGAAITAQYYTGMKLVRGDDAGFFKGYLKSFRDNFKQATGVWIFELLIGAFLTFDWYIIYRNGGENYNLVLRILLGIVTVFFVMAVLDAFALIARFEMSTKEMIKGAFAYTYTNVPRMLFVVVLTAFPTVASIKHFDWFVAIWPIGSAASLYVISYNYVKSFKKLELHVLGTDTEDEDDSLDK